LLWFYANRWIYLFNHVLLPPSPPKYKISFSLSNSLIHQYKFFIAVFRFRSAQGMILFYTLYSFFCSINYFRYAYRYTSMKYKWNSIEAIRKEKKKEAQFHVELKRAENFSAFCISFISFLIVLFFKKKKIEITNRRKKKSSYKALSVCIVSIFMLYKRTVYRLFKCSDLNSPLSFLYNFKHAASIIHLLLLSLQNFFYTV